MKILIFVLIWAAIFSLAIMVPRLIEPTGDGFTRGMNRLPVTLGLHCLGFLGAAFIAGLSYRTRAELETWLLVVGFAPLVIDLLGIILIVGLVVFHL